MDYFADLPFADRTALTARLAAFSEAPAPTPDLLTAAIAVLPVLRAHLTEAVMVGTPREPIVWYDYESRIWGVGEGVRQLLKRHRRLRHAPGLWPAVERVCQTPAYGKGRESWTMLLGQYGGPERAPALLGLLDDADVAGHALYALRLLGAPGAEARAREFLASPKAWVRGEARKYLAKRETLGSPAAAT